MYSKSGIISPNLFDLSGLGRHKIKRATFRPPGCYMFRKWMSFKLFPRKADCSTFLASVPIRFLRIMVSHNPMKIRLVVAARLSRVYKKNRIQLHPEPPLFYYPCVVSTIFTRRLAELSEATGQHSPIPTAVTRTGSMPRWVKALLTAFARRSESCRLYCSLPVWSV